MPSAKTYSEGRVSTIPPSPQPDQTPERWNNHVSVYEAVFEPFSVAFARAAFDAIGLKAGMRVLDVGAGSGGAALELAARGCRAAAIDASPAMVARICERASEHGVAVEACVMDGQCLEFPPSCFDAAISIFGVILFPDAVRGLAEMRRVVQPGGRVAVVTWTEPQHYELAIELRAAVQAVKPDTPPSALPAQLRFRERDDFIALFRAAGFDTPKIEVRSETLVSPSARWLGDRLRFAPGMAAQLEGLGALADAATERFVSTVEAKWGTGPTQFTGKAFIGTALVP